MGKYATLETDVYSIFGSDSWRAEKILARPSNFMAISKADTFIRVSVIPGNAGINVNSISGLLLIEIFIPAGKGNKMAFEIADTLDDHLVGRSVKTGQGTTQFQNSTCTPSGNDKVDQALFMYEYSIPFSYYNGE